MSIKSIFAKLDAIRDYVRDNGGATLTADGLDVVNIEKGYCVSLDYVGEKDARGLEGITATALLRMMKRARKYRGFVGLWLDVDGTLYIDVTTIYDDYKEAVFFGRLNRQIAIYDASRGVSIAI